MEERIWIPLDSLDGKWFWFMIGGEMVKQCYSRQKLKCFSFGFSAKFNVGNDKILCYTKFWLAGNCKMSI